MNNDLVDDPEDIRMTVEHARERLDAMADTVLAYRPKTQQKKLDKRQKRRAKRATKKKGRQSVDSQ